MDKSTYTFSQLTDKYGKFAAPDFEITIGTKKLDNKVIIITGLTIDITAGYEAGGCSFDLEGLYDYKNSIFKESALSTVKVGAKLSIKTGYIKKKEVFKGFIDEVTVNYTGDAPYIHVSGIDAKGFLMNSNTRMYLNKTKVNDAVKKILSNCVSKGYAASVTMGTLTPFEAELIQNDTDDYHFLVNVAELMGLNFFVVNGEIVYKDVFADTSPIIKLDMGLGLMSFSKTMSLYKQVGKVSVYSIDPKTGKKIKGEASSVSVTGTGNTAVQTADKFKAVEEVEFNYLVHTDAECKKLAQARLNALALQYVSGEGRCVGIPEIIPGRYIEISGIDKNSAGKYFINTVRHSFEEDGYYTIFTIKGAKSK